MRERLAALQRGEDAPSTDAATYDDHVAAAIARLRPDLDLRDEERRSAFRPDFCLLSGQDRLWVETKWRSDRSTPFRGRTLTSIISGLSATEKLLVIANSEDVSAAVALVNAQMKGRGRVVGWLSNRDDDAVKVALDEMIPRTAG